MAQFRFLGGISSFDPQFPPPPEKYDPRGKPRGGLDAPVRDEDFKKKFGPNGPILLTLRQLLVLPILITCGRFKNVGFCRFSPEPVVGKKIQPQVAHLWPMANNLQKTGSHKLAPSRTSSLDWLFLPIPTRLRRAKNTVFAGQPGQ